MKRPEPTWTLSASTLVSTEFTTSRAFIGDYYCWSDHKKRSQILAQFAAASFAIAEIMKGRLTGDRLSWRRTKFKLVAYVSNLLGSNNVRFNVLGEGLKEMLNIAGPYLTS